MRILHLGAYVLLSSVLMAPTAWAASAPVGAAEDSLYLDASIMHTQYHENLSPGDDESGYTPGFGIGASILSPMRPASPASLDLYAALDYDFNAGNLKYSGHYQAPPFGSGQPLDTSDRAVFNRIEARLGLGIPLATTGELIPYIAGGYQAWNRNDDVPGGACCGEFYDSGLFGFGLKFDQPVAPGLVFSADSEILGLAGGNVKANGTDFGRGFGVTAQERVELGLDEAISGRLHVFYKAYWEHFNYSGTHPEYLGDGSSALEPFSTTDQFAILVGAGYSFYGF